MNVPKQVNKDIPRTRKCPLDYLNNPVKNSLFLKPTDPKEIEAIILSLNNSKSSGPFSIPIRLLKTLAKGVSESYSLIVNDSFMTGVYPTNLKVAKVVDLRKKGPSDNPTNYRPISLLSVFSKILDKLMHKRLNNFVDINNVTHPLQFGFRQKHSTTHALTSLTEKLKQTIDKGNHGCGVFIDLKKAFDTVNHSILLKSLNIVESEVYLYNGSGHTCLVESNMSQLLVIFLKLWKSNVESHRVLCLDHYFFSCT